VAKLSDTRIRGITPRAKRDHRSGRGLRRVSLTINR
jgi:hypothetical protein